MTGLRTLLLIDNDPSHANIFREALPNLPDGPFECECVATLAEGIERLGGKDIWAIFLNLSLPDSHGSETFDRLLLAVPGIPTLVLGGVADENIALEALRRGAKDYLLEDHVDGHSFVRAIRNMAERHALGEALFAERERTQVTLNLIGDAVISTDIAGNVTYLNAAAEKLTGWPRTEASGKPLADVFEIIDVNTRKSSPNSPVATIVKHGTVGLTPNCILIRRDRQECAIEDSAAPIHDRQGALTGAVIVFRGISQAPAMGLEMSHLAQYDILTNLPNRLLFKDRLSQAVVISRRHGRHVAVLCIDLDGFKQVNDSLGHECGDKLLQSVAKRLLASVRDSDTVSRQDGDEFLVFLSEIKHAKDAGISARKILNGLVARHQIDEHSLRVTASIGVTTYPDDGEEAEILIRNAELAMSQAKQSDRNTYQFFDEDLNRRAVERQVLEKSLRSALERDEFILHYQPKIDLRSGNITGVEALIRWSHPDRGLIGPQQFISIAEDCGLMLSIGQWVLRESCTQARAWQDAGLRTIELAVNVSAVEFRSSAFLEGVRTILTDTRFEPRYLQIELAESVLTQRIEFTVPLLQQLKAMGVHIAIDDFGTGYSSLSYLRQFPIDTLKVNQSFVREIDADTDNSTIISSVINMGRNLKHRVIAEGVETAEQLAFLQLHGCNEGQGYYFSRPVPGPQFAKLLETGISAVVLH